MKKSKVKLTPVFQTKEQEELFARCAQESMHKTMTGEISYLSIDVLKRGYQRRIFKTLPPSAGSST